jgi:2-oxo-4-hydroxy-4-carboxy-5-ureidoimidazoline decarboxylase
VDAPTSHQLGRRPPRGLAALNQLSSADTRRALLAVCASTRWADAVTAARPYRQTEDLLAAAHSALRALDDRDVDEALARHPRIGERVGGGRHGRTSTREQAAVSLADQQTLDALAEGNRAYEERFGHIYLVFASGRSAEELLAVLHRRLDNDAETERRVVRDELAKINRLRLERLVDELGDRP